MYLYGDSWSKLKGQLRSEKWEVFPYGVSRFKLKGQLRCEKWEVHLYGDSRFMLQDECRSEKWELYLYGDKTIKVERVSLEVLPRGVFRSGSSPNLVTDHTILGLCLLSERGMV